MEVQGGRRFSQIQGPPKISGRVLRAMTRPIPDHRGPEFQALAYDVSGEFLLAHCQ